MLTEFKLLSLFIAVLCDNSVPCDSVGLCLSLFSFLWAFEGTEQEGDCFCGHCSRCECDCSLD